MTKGIIITGLTGSGKTSIAYELARRINGEVINLDRTFTWKRFSLGSGLSDVHDEKGVVKHLYEFLEPDQELVPNDKFADLVINIAKDIVKRGKIPIVEGGSPKYFKDLYFKNKELGIFPHIVYLNYPENTDIKDKILKRINSQFEKGLLEEIKGNLAKYRNTQFMREGKFVVPVIDYIDGKIDIDTAKNKMVEGTMDLVKYQRDDFSSYKDLIVLENKDREDTLKKIINLS